MDKTPISRLQEVCARNNIQPEYQLLSVEGVVHAPTFVYRVQVGDFSATASGQSKKKAKHAVAKLMIETLVKESNFNFPDKETLEDCLISEAEKLKISSKNDDEDETSFDDNGLNPVGRLQEICMKLHWRPPNYKTIGEEGLPHERVFKMECFLENMNFVEIGMGNSKRIAKRNAALNMIKRLKEENLADLDEILTHKKGKGDSPFITSWFNKNKNKSEISGVQKLDDFYYNLIDNQKEFDKINQIVNECLESDDDYDIISALFKLVSHLNCSVKFITLPELSTKNEYQSLVHLFPKMTKDNLIDYSHLPILTAFGSGQTTDEAKQAAAFRSFKILKLYLNCYKTTRNIGSIK